MSGNFLFYQNFHSGLGYNKGLDCKKAVLIITSNLVKIKANLLLVLSNHFSKFQGGNHFFGLLAKNEKALKNLKSKRFFHLVTSGNDSEVTDEGSF